MSDVPMHAAALEHPDGTYSLLWFRQKPGYDMHRSAELAGLLECDQEFVVYSIIPNGVDALRYIIRKNTGQDTALCRDSDGVHFYRDLELVDSYIRRWRQGELA